MFKVARRHQPALPDAELRTAWQACSTLLDYPTEALMGSLAAIDDAVSALPADLAIRCAGSSATCGRWNCAHFRSSTSPPSTTPAGAPST